MPDPGPRDRPDEPTLATSRASARDAEQEAQHERIASTVPAEQVPRDEDESLWWLTAGPLLWVAHFLASYLTAAVWCAKAADPGGSLGPVPWAIGLFTLTALGGIAYVAHHGWRRHSLGSASVPHDFDTPHDRHRFLGFATLLLAGLSGVAVLYGSLVALVFRSCR